MTSPKNTHVHNVCIVLLSLLSIIIIFYRFPSIPQNLSFDETEFARLALSLDNKPYTPYSSLATGHTTGYFYILLTSLKMLGVNAFALRLPAAIFGVAGTFIFYLIAKHVFSKEYIHKAVSSSFLERHDYLIPSILTFIFLTTRWYINFARYSFEATFLLLLELVSILFFLKYKKSKKFIHLGISGLFAGLAYNSYTPGRLFFLLPLLFLLWEFKNIRQIGRHIVKPLASFIVPLVLVIMPVTVYLSIHPDIRINQLSYVTNDKMQVGEKIEFGIDNIKRAVLMFHVNGDMNGRHNYPGKATLNPLAGFFFAIGFIYSLRKFRQFEHAFFLTYFVFSMLPMMLTYPWENPNILRSFTTIPSIIFFIGNAILLLYKLPLKHKYLSYGLCIIFYIAAVYDMRTYFVYMANTVFPSAFEIDPLLFPSYIKGMYEWLYKFDTIQKS